jgi:hypothetical protein
MLRKCKILIQNDLLNCLTYSGVGGQFSKSLWINRLRLRSILIAVLRFNGRTLFAWISGSLAKFAIASSSLK